jgi:hypothetical protein
MSPNVYFGLRIAEFILKQIILMPEVPGNDAV